MRRTVAAANDGSGPCPACHQPTAIDVSYDSIALTLCDADERGARRTGVSRAFVLAMLSLPIILTLVGLGQPGALWVGTMSLLIVCAVISSLSIRRGPRRARPRRWHLVDPPRQRVHRTHTGPVFGRHRLRAPLSGRECIAYEIAIAPAGMRPRNDRDWLVREQLCAQLVIGDHATEGSDVALLVDPADRESLRADPAAIDRFLRARGMMTHETVDVYETIVTKGQVVALQSHRGSRIHTLRLSSSRTNARSGSDSGARA